mgnify:CR=1 FL=1|tara:strand:+ start:108867 stop:109475 length:609 start_codon:yes stop_codon:yes gene_type:complete
MSRIPILILSIFISILSFAQSNNSENVKQIAKSDAINFFNLIPQGQENEYGFSKRSDFDKVEIGEPYQVYFVVKKDGAINFKSTNNWRVPVLVDGKSVALLTVISTKGGAKVVDFGATGLAAKLQEFEAEYTASNERVLIRNTYLSVDYIVPQFSALVDSQSEGLLALKSTTTAKLYPISRSKIASLKPASFVAATLNAVSN